MDNYKNNIAILGGGPSGLFMYKRLVECGETNLTVHIFERSDRLGAGMPYSKAGANDEHVTNVSGNEIPEIVTPISEWIKTVPKDTLNKFKIDSDRFNDYKVLPRLLFGDYLSDQFKSLLQKAKLEGIETNVHYNTAVADIIDQPDNEKVIVVTSEGEQFEFDRIILSTGHYWPKKYEGIVPGWFDSPYPPIKLAFRANHTIGIKGSSLTAVDAIRTLSRHNGTFDKNNDGRLIYTPDAASSNFKIALYSRNGFLPAVRFHLEDSHLENDLILTDEEITAHIKSNGGFLSLDYLFDKDFKEPFKDKEPKFYDSIKSLTMEQFVEKMIEQRESRDAFELMKAEYAEAQRSIEQKKSIYWKEMLGVLSFAMNYPAKHFSAEDMLRLQKVLQPLISVVIAYIPQSSCEELLALYEAGRLEITAVGDDGEVEPGERVGAVYNYTDHQGNKVSTELETYVDSVGQRHFSYAELPFKSLLDDKTVAPAKLRFCDAETGRKAMDKNQNNVTLDVDGNYYLRVPGIAINDSFQVVDAYGALNDRIYVMAVPYIGGYNPDYSGLDFSEAASKTIIESMYKIAIT